jgi:hypothetical protein
MPELSPNTVSILFNVIFILALTGYLSYRYVRVQKTGVYTELTNLINAVESKLKEEFTSPLFVNTHPLLHRQILSSIVVEILQQMRTPTSVLSFNRVLPYAWKAFMHENFYSVYKNMYPTKSGRELLTDFYGQTNSMLCQSDCSKLFHKTHLPFKITEELNDFFTSVDCLVDGDDENIQPMTAKLESYLPSTLSTITEYINNNCASSLSPKLSMKLFILEWVALQITDTITKLRHCFPRTEWVINFKWDKFSLDTALIQITVFDAEEVPENTEIHHLIDFVIEMFEKQSYRNIIHALFSPGNNHTIQYKPENFECGITVDKDFNKVETLVDFFSNKKMAITSPISEGQRNLVIKLVDKA